MLITTLIVFNFRLTLQQDKEKRQKADLLHKNNMVQLRRKEGQSIKKIEMSPKVENTTRTQAMALKTVRKNKVNLSLVKFLISNNILSIIVSL